MYNTTAHRKRLLDECVYPRRFVYCDRTSRLIAMWAHNNIPGMLSGDALYQVHTVQEELLLLLSVSGRRLQMACGETGTFETWGIGHETHDALSVCQSNEASVDRKLTLSKDDR